ncbi:MAG: gamma-glutamylcyclotransferase [Pseudomonadota bacterium]
MTKDPFRHHPGLRSLITAPEQSYFRDISAEKVRASLEEHGVGGDILPMLSDAEREADRDAALAEYGPGDVWIFGYGSLMWDPAVRFAEVRRARVAGLARRFILKDVYGGRGDRERPGLMVALDHVAGAHCDGLVYRIDADLVDTETRILWARERIGPAYLSAVITAETALGPVRTLTFLADHSAELIAADLSFDQQVEYCATGTGFLGSSLDYARNIAAHFQELGIDDPDVTRLVTAAKAHTAAASSG